jgi:hypothetical protein
VAVGVGSGVAVAVAVGGGVVGDAVIVGESVVGGVQAPMSSASRHMKAMTRIWVLRDMIAPVESVITWGRVTFNLRV